MQSEGLPAFANFDEKEEARRLKKAELQECCSATRPSRPGPPSSAVRATSFMTNRTTRILVQCWEEAAIDCQSINCWPRDCPI